MIPPEIADLADLIWPGWAELDDEASREVIKAARRIHDAGYRPTSAGGRDAHSAKD